MRTSTRFVADFSKFMVFAVCTNKGEKCGHFSDKVQFSRFWANIFYGRPPSQTTGNLVFDCYFRSGLMNLTRS